MKSSRSRAPLLLLLSSLSGLAFSATDAAPKKDRHVVVIVWDGMRPDFVTEQNAPTLWKLSQEGVTFRHHHAVFPTMTDVNAAAIATGVYPNLNSLSANREYRPRIDPNRPFENADVEVIRKGDQVSGGKYLAVTSTAEIIRAAGMTTAIAGAKSAAFLQDRHAEWASATSKDAVTRFAAAPMPPGVREEALRLLGPFLTGPSTGEQRNLYATRALLEIMWRDKLPNYSFLWLSDPDLTQHEYSPGAEKSMTAIRNSDRNLAAVLDAITKKNARETTDVFIVSDHGFSTIERAIDFPETLRTAGFDAVDAFKEAPKPGQIMVVTNGGTILFYVIEHDAAVTARLVDWLQHSDFAGVIFTSKRFDGTFLMESVRTNTADAPDVMVALRWNAKPNRFGIPGHIIADSARPAGQGSHASLSEFDVHNTLIAAGPSFRPGLRSDLPSGNIDLAPTTLHLLGLEPPHKFDGRILSEALKEGSTAMRATAETLESKRKFDSGEWHQYLKLSHVGETTYFDQGNGTLEIKKEEGGIKK